MSTNARRRFVDLTERIIYLRSIPVTAVLPPPVLKIIANYLHERSFAKGDMLMREGEPITALHLLTEGRLSLIRKGKPFGTLAPPQSLGFLGILARGDGTYDATAETDTRTLELDADTLIELLEDHFELLHATTRYLAERVLYELMELPAETLESRLDAKARIVPSKSETDIVERIVYLRGIRAFAHTNLNALAALAKQLVELRVDPGTELWGKGSTSDATLMVLSGSLQCTASDGEKEWRAGPDSVLGGLEVIASKPHWYRLVAESSVIAFRLPFGGFSDLLEDAFPMAMGFISMLASDLVGIMERKAAAGQSTVGVKRDMAKLGAVPVGA